MADKKDNYRREVGEALVAAISELRDAERRKAEFQDEVKELTPLIKNRQKRVNELAEDLHRIENGQYQPTLLSLAAGGDTPAVNGPTLLDEKEEEVQVDPASTAPIGALVDHGVTAKQVEMIEESDLAREHAIKTVADLERAIRDDEWWHKKIKGIGKTKIDKLIDALVSYRAAFPVPVEDDEPAEDGEFSLEIVCEEVVTLPEPCQAMITVGLADDLYYVAAVSEFSGNTPFTQVFPGSDSPSADSLSAAIRSGIDQLLFEARSTDQIDDAEQAEIVAALLELREKWCLDEDSSESDESE